jgi:hypothetical protein
MLRHRAEYCFQKRFKILTLAPEVHVCATRGGGDSFQSALVEMRFYQGTRVILDEVATLIRR